MVYTNKKVLAQTLPDTSILSQLGLSTAYTYIATKYSPLFRTHLSTARTTSIDLLFLDYKYSSSNHYTSLN